MEVCAGPIPAGMNVLVRGGWARDSATARGHEANGGFALGQPPARVNGGFIGGWVLGGVDGLVLELMEAGRAEPPSRGGWSSGRI